MHLFTTIFKLISSFFFLVDLPIFNFLAISFKIYFFFHLVFLVYFFVIFVLFRVVLACRQF